MINRTAETLFWIGRYLERAENYTRQIDINYHMRHVLTDHHDECKWERLIGTSSDINLFRKLNDETNEASVLQFLTFELKNQNSLLSCIAQVRNNIRSLRQLLPCELWESINGFYLWFKEQDIAKIKKQSPYIFYQRTKEWLALFNGTADSTMLRDDVWNFIQLGKFFERAEHSTGLLHSFYSIMTKDNSSESNPTNYHQLIILLKSVGAYEAFRKLFADNVTFTKATEFLISHQGFPRSVKYSLMSIDNCLAGIKHLDYQYELISKKILDLIAAINIMFTDINRLEESTEAIELINIMLKTLSKLGFEISRTFFQEEFVGA